MTLVDVRTEGEYEADGRPDFVNIPLDTIPSRIEEFRNMKKPIVLCCRSGARSSMAQSILLRHGIDVEDGGPCKSLQ